MRLIDADALAKAFREASETDDSKDNRTYWSEALISAAEEVDDAPTVDAVERKHGEWIKMSDADGIYLACSICGENLPRVWRFLQFDLFPKLKSIDKTNYCPNCGADMRGENNG